VALSPIPPRISAQLVCSLLTPSFLVDPEDLVVPEVLADPEDPVAQEVQEVLEDPVAQVRVELHFASTHHCTPFPALPLDLPCSCGPRSDLP